MRQKAALDPRSGGKRLRAEMPELVAKAEQGDADSLFELGNRYFFGEGAATDIARAFEYYRRAAEAGSDAGMVNLASCYRNGEGVRTDPARGAEWYEKAMTTDKTFAPYELAQMYENGEGVERNRERAMELYAVALDGGHPDAMKALRRLGQLAPGAQASVRR
jgi:uncharacterized protein